MLVRALQGLSDAARLDASPDASSLWAGLFDLRDNLLGSTVDDLRALARAWSDRHKLLANPHGCVGRALVLINTSFRERAVDHRRR